MAYVKDILAGIKFRTKDAISDLEVGNVTANSKETRGGDLFIAVKGYSTDGHKFIKEAISKGAKAVLAEEDFRAPKGVKKILIRRIRKAVPLIANNFYGHPSERLRLIGVTGTNGKTTITYIIEHILKNAGKASGVIGTINYRFKDKVISSKNTTPGPLELGAMLAEMAREGLPYAIMEVSSHSLDQGRVDGLYFDIGLFTNITFEHLDYHKTLERYLKAKTKLFDRLKERGTAILNMDDKTVARLKGSIKNRVLTYGMSGDSDIQAEGVALSLDGTTFRAVTPKGSIDIRTALIGSHNVSNILASIAVGVTEGIDLETIKEGVESFSHVPGRLERVESGQPFKIFVDYAHTEDALYNILSILRKVAKKNIITVFGCGGNRDRKKRPLMGTVACRFSDRVIITSDNPRFEEPEKIIGEIERGIKNRFSNYDIVVDRHDAIEKALNIAGSGDIVVIAGKGHEQYQIVKEKVIPFDDRETVRAILNK